MFSFFVGIAVGTAFAPVWMSLYELAKAKVKNFTK